MLRRLHREALPTNTQFDNSVVRQSVERKVGSHIRVLQVLLYIYVALFTVIGMTKGILWLIPPLGTLFVCWYMMGEARVYYEYQLDRYILKALRTSGMRSKQKTVEFLCMDLRTLVIMAEDGLSILDEAEEASKAAVPKRITYDISAHDKDKGCYVMYAEGIGAEAGRKLRVYFSPGPELKNAIRMLCPGKVHLTDE